MRILTTNLQRYATGRIDIEPFPRPLYTSKDGLSAFLFSRFDIAPYAFILAFRDLEP